MNKAKSSLFLNKYKPQQDGSCPISVRISYKRAVKYYPTGEAMQPEQFNRIKERSEAGKTILRVDNHLHEVFSKATDRLNHAKDIINDQLSEIFTFGLFEQYFLSNAGAVDSVSAGFEKYIQELRTEGRIGTAVTYECAQKSIESFRKGMRLADITDKTLKDYERWMLKGSSDKKGCSKATVGIYLRSLRTIFNQANLDKSLYPFGKGKNKYTIPKGRNLKKALHLSEIAKIFQYQPKAGSTSEMARDYWVFLYLCNGMNIKDMCLLKRKNIDGNTITYQRAKTINSQRDSKQIFVSLKPEAKEVVSKWGQVTLDPEGYIFPHFKKGVTPEQEREIIQNLTKLINKYMKQIASELEIDKPVTTYYARHSFATVLKRAGVSTEMISEMLRHSSQQMTQNYLDGFEDEQIHEATNVLTSFSKLA